MLYRHTERELAKYSKDTLARMHHSYGGLMGLATYRKWTKDELVRAVMEDEQHQPEMTARTVPTPLDGCTCGGIGDTGSHRGDCQWSAR